MPTRTLERKLNTTLAPSIDRLSLCKPCKTCGVIFKHPNYHQWQCAKCDPETHAKYGRDAEYERKRRSSKAYKAKLKAKKALTESKD